MKKEQLNFFQEFDFMQLDSNCFMFLVAKLNGVKKFSISHLKNAMCRNHTLPDGTAFHGSERTKFARCMKHGFIACRERSSLAQCMEERVFQIFERMTDKSVSDLWSIEILDFNRSMKPSHLQKQSFWRDKEQSSLDFGWVLFVQII